MFEGPVLRLLARLASPIFFGMIFQLLYNVTDTIWISRIDLADPSYVGGTGIIFPFLFLAIALSQGIVVGTSSLVARAIGEGDKQVLDKTAESGLAVGIVVAMVMATLTYIFATDILRLLGAEGDYLVHGLEYLRFIVPAGILLFFSSAFIGILSRSFFQAIGYPLPALLITTSRLLLLAVPAMLLYVCVLDLKIYGVWLGIITGNVLAAGMSAFWISRTLQQLQRGTLRTAKT